MCSNQFSSVPIIFCFHQSYSVHINLFQMFHDLSDFVCFYLSIYLSQYFRMSFIVVLRIYLSIYLGHSSYHETFKCAYVFKYQCVYISVQLPP